MTGDDGRQRLEELLARAEAAAEDWEKVALLSRAASVAEEALFDLDAAERLWRRALAVDPRNENGWAALDRIYTAQRRYEHVREVLALRLSAAEDAAEVLALRCRLAALLEDELEDAPKAVEAWQAVLDLDPSHGGALAALERLFLADARWAELAEVYERRLDLESEPAERRRVGERLATLCGELLGDAEKARAVRERLGLPVSS